MRIKVLAFAASLLLTANSSVGFPQAPTTPASSTQASTLLGQSAKALTGTTAVNDVTLTGTVEWIAGSDDETGTVTYKGISGAYRLDMTFRNGTRSEIISTVDGIPSGIWIGLDGTSHSISNHNLMVDAGWFLSFTLENQISSSSTVLAYIGPETWNNSSVIHISASQQLPGTSSTTVALMQHLTQVEIYLDPSTYLPVCYAFNSHPDNDASLDIPTEIRYSNFQTVHGIVMPLHVQKFVNNVLALDIQIQSASLNAGISASQIGPQ